MAPPQKRKVSSGFTPDLQIDLKGLCKLLVSWSASSQPVAVVWYQQVVHSPSNECKSTVSRLVVVKQTLDPKRDHWILNMHCCM